jgi:hypothetical protein
MTNHSPSQAFIRLMQPSLFSSIVTFIVVVVGVLIILVPSLYEGSPFELYLNSSEFKSTGLYTEYDAISDQVNSSKFAADASVFVIWALVGLVGYALVLSIVKFGYSIMKFVSVLEYTKSDREEVAKEALLHLCVRVGAAILLYIAYVIFMKLALPYMLFFAQHALGSSQLLGSVYVLLIAGIITVSFHALVILLRLVMLQTRIFFSNYSVAE